MNNTKSGLIPKKDISALIAIYIFYGLGSASNEFRTLFLKDQGLTATECGRVLAMASLLCVFAGPVASTLADKLRSRRIVYLASSSLWLAAVIGLLILGKMRIAGFVLCAGFMPLISVFDPTTYNMIEASGVNASMMIPKLDFSFIRAMLSAGYCLINFAYTPLVERFGSSMPFICTAVFIAVLIILSGALKSFETEKAADTGKKNDLQLGRIFRSYYLISYLVICFIHSLGMCHLSYLVYLMNEIGMDNSLVGTANGVRVAGEIIFMFLLIILKKKISLPMLQGISVILQVIQMVVFVHAPSPVVIFIALAIGGAAGGINVGTKAVYLRILAPQGLDTVTLSLYSAIYSVGNIIMFVLGGMIIDSMGIFALYRLSAIFFAAWVVLFYGSYLFGRYALKIEPILTMLTPWRNPKHRHTV